MIKLHSRL